MKKSTVRNIFLILIILISVLMIAYLLGGFNKPEVITYNELITGIENGNVEDIYISSYSVKVRYKDSKITKNAFPKNADAQLNIGFRTELEAKIYEMQFNSDKYPNFKMPSITFDNPTDGNFWSTWLPVIGLVGVGILLFFMFKQGQGANNKALNFGKTKARLSQNSKVRFADVAGAEEEKEELREVVEFLKAPKKFQDVGARIPKGVLLVGPPGTGKTLFAKAVAGEANVPFFSISGSDFVEMFVGVGASRVRDLFDQAKKNMPCIIFIDEIDAVGRQRGAGLGGGHDEREQTLNQLLVQMDGFEQTDGIIIMAATNRADILDPALMRPGRFDRQIYVNLPDVRGREAIFKVHSVNKPLSGNINFNTLARLTAGFSGADIENLLNEAAILAARSGRKVILMEDIFEGINKVSIGPQKRSRVITESDKRITAYHEAGHAIIAKELKGCDEVQEISIIPRGMAAGYTLTRPENDDSHMSRNKLMDIICMMLGGRASEELVIKDICTGASNDIQRASGIAKKMVTEWGMSAELGNSFWGASEHEVFLGRDFQAQHSYSEEVAGKIDSEIKKIIDMQYEKALVILKKHRVIMDNMVKLLYERETIYADEVALLFANKSLEEILDYVKERDKKQQNIVDKTKEFIVPEAANVDVTTKSEAEITEMLVKLASDANGGKSENATVEKTEIVTDIVQDDKISENKPQDEKNDLAGEKEKESKK